MDMLIVPKNCSKILQITLPHPKENKPQHYFYDEDNLALYEIIKYSDPYRSWFLDNLFCKDGHFNILTKVDPLFILLPQLMKYAGEQFRTIHDVCSSFATNSEGFDRLDYSLSPDINWNLICDTQELDDELFVRHSKEKTLKWLLDKHERTSEALKSELSSKASTATLISHASDLIDQYIPSSLSAEFKIKARDCKVICRGLPDKTTAQNVPDLRNNGNGTKKPKVQEKPSTSAIPKNSVANFFNVKKKN